MALPRSSWGCALLLLLCCRSGTTSNSSEEEASFSDTELPEQEQHPVVLLQQNLQLLRPESQRKLSNQGRRKPNLLLILLDQWRADWDGLETSFPMPTVRSLAEQGTRFTRAYTSSPLCAPARASMAAAREYKEMWVLNNTGVYVSPRMSPTFMTLLREAGYTTMLAGKDHWSGESGELMNATEMEILGVDLYARVTDKYAICWYMAEDRASDYFGLHLKEIHKFQDYCKAVGIYGDGHCCNQTQVCDTVTMFECGFRCQEHGCFEKELGVDRWSRLQAQELLLRHWKRHGAHKPWYMQLGFPGPHPPFLGGAKLEENTPIPSAVDAQFDTIWAKKDGKLLQVPSPNRQTVDVDASREGYASLLHGIDYEISEMLKFLKKHDAWDDTIIAVTSDHGEHVGDHGEFGKSSPWEPSVRIPMIFLGPGVRKNATEERPVSLIDVSRTLLDLAHAQPSPEMDGHSLLPALTGVGNLTRQAVLSGLHNNAIKDGTGWESLYQFFEVSAALFPGNQFLKLVCCPYGCSKMGSLLPVTGAPQVALMNVTPGVGAETYEHDVLNKPMGRGVQEALQLLPFLSEKLQSACRPLLT